VEELLAQKPTLANARKRLGGRDATGPGAGRIVAIDAVVGVVLFEANGEVDVVLESGLVRRTSASRCSAHEGEVAWATRAVADSARVFASLHEGDDVCYEPANGPPAHGKLLEKCRYGALVATSDGRILAVGFRKLSPVASGACS
jgi:hypothetical protein